MLSRSPTLFVPGVHLLAAAAAVAGALLADSWAPARARAGVLGALLDALFTLMALSVLVGGAGWLPPPDSGWPTATAAGAAAALSGAMTAMILLTRARDAGFRLRPATIAAVLAGASCVAAMLAAGAEGLGVDSADTVTAKALAAALLLRTAMSLLGRARRIGGRSGLVVDVASPASGPGDQ
ncbi:hypothetical protein AB0B66_09935 [Catellatospora sp. NPDC049111]|uniref:hypothetical protein n=1 Tax=Catellatospora sp. NPDC049111 TaxID=3155271 RepID=UPI0033E9E1E1